MDCIICYEEINILNNDFIILECCKQNFHINCLKNWVNFPKNKNNKNCPVCRKETKIFSDFRNNTLINSQRQASTNININNPNEIVNYEDLEATNQRSQASTNININNHNEIVNYENLEATNQHSQEIYRCFLKFKCCCCFFGIIISFLVIIAVL